MTHTFGVSGRWLSKEAIQNKNQTEDFGGLNFYNVVGNWERIFVGEKKVCVIRKIARP